MLKDLGVKPYLFPMPVLMIATYGDGDKIDVMNMAWGGICASNMVALNIDEDHKTTENLKKRGAFTLSIADIPHIEAADFFGIATGNKINDKFERSGLHQNNIIRTFIQSEMGSDLLYISRKLQIGKRKNGRTAEYGNPPICFM